MAFLRREGGEEGGRRVVGRLVYLRHPELKDFPEWSALRERSRAFLTPWEPTWAEDELTRAAYRYRLRRYADDIRDGRGYAFFAFRKEDDRLVGGLTLSRVQRGVAQMCSLGYWVGEPYQGRGYTTDGVRAAVTFAFEELGLHRVEAAVQPANTASRRVLSKAGFQEEGFARAYLKIAGAWCDHVLFGRVRDDE
jgi:ribosomal-protein-alanine N-acetyltransferase